MMGPCLGISGLACFTRGNIDFEDHGGTCNLTVVYCEQIEKDD